VKWLNVDANLFIGCPRGGEMREIEKWAWLALCLSDLRVPHDLIEAIVTIVKMIEKRELT
jgi:23S rRNA pseudoU1915 N3-methylase RlmH